METAPAPVTAGAHPVDRFCRMFARLTPDEPMALEEVYAPDVVFEDPFHRLEGRDALGVLFARMNAQIRQATFAFSEPLIDAGRASLPWTLRLEPRRFAKVIVVDGISLLEFDSAITRHRDYFDGGQLVYENVPLLGSGVRAIRRRL